MAWTDAYGDAATYRNRVGKTIVTDDAAVLLSLTAISRYIERELGNGEAPRVFNQSPAGETRYFDASGADYRSHPISSFGWQTDATLLTRDALPVSTSIVIDDLVTFTSMGVDTDGDGTYETALAITDIYVMPYNAAIMVAPYTRIELRPTQAAISHFPTYPKGISITGVWGWPSVPQPIIEAVIQLASILRLETPRAEAQVSELGQAVGMSKEGTEIVRSLMKTYKRRSRMAM